MARQAKQLRGEKDEFVTAMGKSNGGNKGRNSGGGGTF